ncbi:MAG: winged helix-turn-helix transcriptional regulator [Clostridia bacterium]|nr:winged helix-turn-helix transcriptional regulator [Clostridia bacterium]
MIQRFEEFTSNIAKAYKSIIKIKGHEMTEYNLKASNVTCLFYLGKHTEGLTATELCALCMEDKAAVSKSLAVLKAEGYVNQPDDGKKYKLKYVITPSGKKVYDEINIVIGKVVEMVGEGLTDEERNIFYKSLGIIVNNLDTLCNGLEDKK